MAKSIRFDGRVAVITGGGSGLGRAYSNLLARRGAAVVVNDLPDDRRPTGRSGAAEAVAAEIIEAGGDAIAVGGDVTSEEAAASVIHRTIEQYGKIDILISNAGTATYVPFQDMSLEQFDRMIRVHLYGTFLVIRAAWTHMVERGYGRIVTTGSAGIFGLDKQAHYGAAKGGVIGLTKSLSVEGRERGILVNAILPFADTPLARKVTAEADIGADSAETTAMLARLGAGPELVAPAVVWLVHEDCQLTGELIQSGMGVAHRAYWAYGAGYVDTHMTVESVRDHWVDIIQADPAEEFRDLSSALQFLIQARTQRS